MNGRLGPGAQGRGHGSQPVSNFPWRGILWLLILLFLLGPWLSRAFMGQGVEIGYSTFRRHLQAGNVAKVTIRGDRISGELRQSAEKQVPQGKPIAYTKFITYVPSFGDNSLLPMLESKKVEINTEPTEDAAFWREVLAGMLPFLIIVGLAVFYFRRKGLGGTQGIFSFGGSRARLYEKGKERTTFSDVAGSLGAKVELQEIIEFLKDPEKIQRLGGKAPKGVLLVGPPGTGKTLLARAVAGEADVPFFSITGSDFMQVFVGVGASRVRSMFEDAKKIAPDIIFIDETRLYRQKAGGGHRRRPRREGADPQPDSFRRWTASAPTST